MLCRILLGAIAISYLVCVLFLSGIQKEDLEVSLLKKMQHYNIDYDKNNQDLRNECLNNSNSVRKSKSDNKTTDKEAATTISTPTTIAAILDTKELQSVLKYLKHKKKIRNPPTTESSTWKTTENTEKVKRLFEPLISENDDNVRKLNDIPKGRKEGSALDEINKYFIPFNSKLDQLISQTSKKPKNETSVNQTTQNKGNATKDTGNKDNNVNIFSNIEQIGKAVAEYLSKKTTVAPETTTVSPKTSTLLPKIQLESEKNVSEHPRIISQDIEQKFALSIAAINKLNENIAILQKHLNGTIFFNSNTSNQSNVNVENFTKLLPDGNSHKSQSDKTKNVPKSAKYSNRNSIVAENVDFNIQVQSDHLQNSQAGFAYSVNNSLDTLPTKYDTSRFSESFFIEKNNPNRPTPNLKDMIAPSVTYDKQKLPKQAELMYPVAPSSNSNSEMAKHSQKIKEIITNYSYEKETIPENLNGELNLKEDPNDPMVYIPRPQILPNVIDYSYYNTKQPTNNIHNFQYNADAAENVVMQNENQDIPPYNINAKTVQDEHVADDNVDIYKNKQIQYPDVTQIDKESIQNGFEKQTGLDTQLIDIQSIMNILKKKKLPLSIQNSKDKLDLEYYDGQKGPVSHILNPEESLFNTNFMMNKENDNQEQKKDLNNPFSVEMISKIAETVKEIVLKDLKKQMISNTFSTAVTTTLSTTTTATTTTPTTTTVAPTTTTIALTTTTPVTATTPSTTTTSTPKTTTTTISSFTSTSLKPTVPAALPYTDPVILLMDTTNSGLTNTSQKIVENKVQVATQTIEKFIQLFEQMKSTQEMSMKPNNKGTKLTGNGVLKPRYNVPPVVMFSPPINPYGMRVPKQMPIIVHNYIPPTLEHPPFPPSFVPTSDTKNSMSPINRPPSYIQPRFPHAVMIQTNTQEIQPLGIPVIKPEAMNMNIIVTTQNPYWSRDPRNRWNYIYGRKPDSKDVKQTNNFNVYSKGKVNTAAPANNIPIEKKDLNNSKISETDNMRINILKQFDTYKKINAERNEENVNGIPLERIRYPSNNFINDSNFQDFINQMAKTNQQMFGVPYNNPMYNGYKISNINPNIMFGQLQNGGFSNQMFPYNAPDSNILNKNIKTPEGIQYGNFREKSTAQHNEISPETFSKTNFNTIINDQMNNLHRTYKTVYLKPSADSQTHNVDTMPTKDINNYSSQLKLYRIPENNQFKEMPSYRVKYSENSRPTFDHHMQNKANYYLENSLSSDGNKANFKNLEKYFDSPNRIEAMKMREKALLKQARDYTKPTYKHSLGNVFSSLDKLKMKYENPNKYYSDEDSNREFKKDKTVARPYQGINTNSRLSDNSKQNVKMHDSQMDLINAVFRNRNRQSGNRDRLHAFDSSDINSPNYRSRVDTSDIDSKGRTIQMESSDSDKYASNVRGFHEKLESSDGWTEQSDCGPNEHCISSVKIMSRQQVPLDSKKPKYDDTRFKNFLQTQEKVNRMLEMILASKPDDGVDTI